MRDNNLVVPIELCHEDAQLPKYQNQGDACFDLKAVELIKDTYLRQWFRTGLKMRIPNGYAGFIYPRSSISEKNLELANSVGVIDSGYRGEIQVRFNKTEKSVLGDYYEVGDRVAQMMIMPLPHVWWQKSVVNSDDQDRGGGFGSTGD